MTPLPLSPFPWTGRSATADDAVPDDHYEIFDARGARRYCIAMHSGDVVRDLDAMVHAPETEARVTALCSALVDAIDGLNRRVRNPCTCFTIAGNRVECWECKIRAVEQRARAALAAAPDAPCCESPEPPENAPKMRRAETI